MSRLRQAQEDAEEVKVIMIENMNKVKERSDKLEDIEERAEQLREKSKLFEKTTVKLTGQKKKEANGDKEETRCKTKTKVGCGIVVFMVMVAVIAALVYFLTRRK
ncbi:hypothetical protein GJAV_G00034820 [Gymnothorax javanicus]|nr:hypothetical protein GJAV_G00034820 [Gymnothorax javanicus]